ncbi:MAG: hypothetical protein WAL75_01135 [Terracidiphilus sp.]
MRLASYVGILSIAVLSLASFPAMGATTVGSLCVSATVVPVCLVSSASILYKSIAAAMTSAASGLTVSCNLNTPYNITVNGKPIPGEAVTDSVTDTAALTAPNSKQGEIIYSPFPRGQAKSAAGSVKSADSSLLPVGFGIEEKTQFDTAQEATDTIVLEVTY